MLEETKEHTLEILGPVPSIYLPQRKIEIFVEDSREMVMKYRRRPWRNLSTKMTKMGIVREILTPQVKEDIEGKIHFNELIDPALVAILDNMSEIGLNFLNNTKIS